MVVKMVVRPIARLCEHDHVEAVNLNGASKGVDLELGYTTHIPAVDEHLALEL